MKTLARFLSLSIAAVLLFGCMSKQVRTIENLKAAYNGESTASAKYAAFAEKAKAEGFDTVAVMFMATSKSESIHASNHLKALEKLGEKVSGPQLGTFNVLTTTENLADAIKGETYEINTMYPGFIAEAEKEKAKDAVKSFSWAVDTEKKHAAFYQKALDAISKGSETGLSLSWQVCPTCGNTYESASVPTACDFCMTSKSKFIVF
jgi:rubrerythrin